MSSSYRRELEKFLSQLDVKAESCLDIGGAQQPVKGRTQSWDVADYKIADMEQPHVGSPKPDIVLDLNHDNEIFDSFDLIFCLEVFEYIWNPVLAFETISDLLTENGRAWISFPFVYPTHNPIEDDALRYTEFGIRKLAEEVNLKIIQIILRRPETDALAQLWRREGMRAAKGYDNNVTGWIVEFQKNGNY